MNQNSTPNSRPERRVRRVCAKPSENTLELLRNFARTYTPNVDHLREKEKLVLN